MSRLNFSRYLPLLFTGLAGSTAVFAEAPAVASGVAAVAGTVAKTPLISPEILFWIAPITSVLSLYYAYHFFYLMKAENPGNARMQEIALAVREGAFAYLKAQYKTVSFIFFLLFLIFAALAYYGIQNPFVPIAFLTGGFFSGLCGYIGMNTATYASNRTAQGASESLNKGLQIAFRSGAVMGLSVVGLGLIDICAWYIFLDKIAFAVQNGVTTGFTLFGIEFVKAGLDQSHKLVEITTTMLTFGMGASTQALFARVGGGIYTKAADVGADLVGKVEAGIPEDDPRNPATIADNVGDNVGDVAGMGADLYESYCGSILATAAIGASIPIALGGGIHLVLAPMIVAGIGNALSIFGVYQVKCEEKASMKTLLAALAVGVWSSSALIIIACILLALIGSISWGLVGSVVAGLLAGVVIGSLTEYYTSDENSPTMGIADRGSTGPATVIIEGLAVGMKSTGWPCVVIVFGILMAFYSAGGYTNFALGLYGVGFAAVGMLATLGITLATDAYGPIADNAGGNAEMSHLGPEVRERTDALDMLGNTTAATGKGFAIGSAALTAMALLAAYLEEIRIWLSKIAGSVDPVTKAVNHFVDVGSVRFFEAGHEAVSQTLPAAITKAVVISQATMIDFATAYDLTVMNPKLLCGIFLGAMMTLIICAMTMQAVGRAAGAMVEEVRRQFREFPGIMTGETKPDYATCVAISTKGAQREMILPSLMAIIIPVLVGMVLGVAGVVGLLVGGLTAGFSVASMLNNAGGAWDNAKKHIEKKEKTYAPEDTEKKFPLTGKGSNQHKATVVGDTVGDPFKDTSGPSLNILIKLMSMVSVVFCGVIVKYGDQLERFIAYLSK
ncbi:MAG: sodium-translocating pyrophosphatase [Candidatus Riflebacteria bacterium]|nr:sodium-translocating pyrophosphatase [Candidatus Riflebacteria bacterium]